MDTLYPIEIYDGTTEQIEIEIIDKSAKQLETIDKSTKQIEIIDKSTKQIEIIDLSTKQIEITTEPSKQIKIVDLPIKQIENINHKLIIKSSRTSEDIINKEYIMNRNKVIDVKDIVKIKKLNIKNGGPIKVNDISLQNLDKYKRIIIDTLYPLC